MVYPLRNLLISFAVIIIVVLLIVLRTFSALRSQEKEQERIRQSRDALQVLGPANTNIREFESLADNYYNTGDSQLLRKSMLMKSLLEQDSVRIGRLVQESAPSDKSSYTELAAISHQVLTYQRNGLPLRTQQAGMHPTTGDVPQANAFKQITERLESENRERLSLAYNKSIDLTRDTFAFVRIISALLLVILLLSFYFVYHDIKTRRKTEAQLKQFNAELERQVEEKTAAIRESELQFRALFNSLAVSEKSLRYVLTSTSENFYVIDRDYRVTLINEAAERNLRKAWGAEVTVGTNITDLIPVERNEPVRASLARVFAGEKVEYEISFQSEGQLEWATVSYDPVTDENAKVIGACIQTSNITERKKAEIELIEAEAKFRHLVEQSLIGVYIIKDARFAYVNPRFAEIFGYKPEEMIGLMPFENVIHPEYRKTVGENVRARVEGEKESVHYEADGLKKDGTVARIEVFCRGTLFQAGTAIIGMLLDISERKKVENEKEQVRYLLNERVKELTTLYRVSQVFQFENRSVSDTLKEIVSILPSGWQYPEITAARIVLLGQEFKTPNFSTGAHRQSASFPVPEVEPGIIEVIYLQQRPQEAEDAFSTEERNLINMVADMLRIYLARKHEGELNKKMQQEILNQKIQDQRTIIRAILNAEERERNKIGRELHDNVNQVLASIKLFLKMASGTSPQQGDLLQRAVQLVDTAISEIRSLSQSQVTPVKKVDLKELIQILVDRLEDSTSIKINFVFEKSRVLDDELKLNIYRIVQEQINNILKHADASEVTILVNAGEHLVKVEVSDNGKGFDPASKRKGIGISNMINRVESFNGEIHIISSPGQGCKIDITIPC